MAGAALLAASGLSVFSPLDAEALAAELDKKAVVFEPLTGGIVHFFIYGESLSDGWEGVPVVTTTQPYDNLMIGQSVRATDMATGNTSWVPTGPVGGDGVYPFNPLVATPEDAHTVTSGETPGTGALNFLRRAYLKDKGVAADPTCRFVVTSCGIGGRTAAELSKGANPDYYSRLGEAATQVRATALSLGLTYQVGAMIFVHGEEDVHVGTSSAAYTAIIQQLQADFLVDVVQGIAGTGRNVAIPWFVSQPDYNTAQGRTTDVYQAMLDMSLTASSCLYLVGTTYQLTDHSVHLTANSYAWLGNTFGNYMVKVLLQGRHPQPLYMTGATYSGYTVVVMFNVPAPPLIIGTAYVEYTKMIYPNLGFLIYDSLGSVKILSATITGADQITIQLARAIQHAPVLQSGYNIEGETDWGTNICDSDATIAEGIYQYNKDVQDSGEDIITWNGRTLIEQPYPLNNYLTVARIAILPA